jgi:hypothetical protein
VLLERACSTCGRGFTAPTPRRGPPRRTCSRSCATRGPRRRVPLAERFWRHVQKTETCWLWTGLHKPNGAGVLTIRAAGRARQVSAARVSWDLHVGPISPGRRIWRRCRRPACVRPDHLVLVRRGSTRATDSVDHPVEARVAIGHRQPGASADLSRRRTWWTRARVLTGLHAFHQATGCAPTTSVEWAHLTGSPGHAHGLHRYPSAYAVLRYFPSFRAAWAAAGVPLPHARWAPWTRPEEEYLARTLGVRPTAEIAATLGRGEGAIYKRARRLGLHVSDAHGWPLQRVARVSGVSERVLRGYVDRGELTVFKGAKFVFVDIANLLVVEEIDWQHPPQSSRRRRGVRSGGDSYNFWPVGTRPRSGRSNPARQLLPSVTVPVPASRAGPGRRSVSETGCASSNDSQPCPGAPTASERLPRFTDPSTRAWLPRNDGYCTLHQTAAPAFGRPDRLQLV